MATYEAALRFKRSPEEVKAYPKEVLVLADLYDRDPAEFADESRWPIEDRNNVLMVWRAKTEAEKFKAQHDG